VTVKELISEVTALGFCDPLSINFATVSAINRAQRQIFIDRRVMGVHTFSVYPKIPVCRIPFIQCKAGDVTRRTVSGEVFSLVAHGTGTVKVITAEGEKLFDHSGKAVRIVGKLCGCGTIELRGNEGAYYTSLVTYDQPSSAESDIHDGSLSVKYSAHDLVSDFHSFVGQPKSDTGYPLSEISIVGSTLIVPYNYSGDISFKYLRAPREVSVVDEEDELDIPEDCKGAIALLVAYYVFLGSDPTLAEKYRELYREAMNRAPVPPEKFYGTGYRNTDGWA